MNLLTRIKLYRIVTICLLLLFAFGCSGKNRPAPENYTAALGTVSAAPEKPDSSQNQSAAPLDLDAEKEAGVSPVVEAKKQKDVKKVSEPASNNETAKEPPSRLAVAEEESATVDTDESEEKGGGAVVKNPTAQAEGDQKPAAEPEKIVLNFDNADLVEVIKTIAELLDINYLLETGVGGSVTIHTAGELDRADLFPVFYQILETNGLTAVKKDSLYRIVPIKEASRMPIAANLGKGDQADVSGGEMIIQLIQLDSIAAAEMTKVLQPFVSANGTMVTLDNANILMVVDQSANMGKILQMVDAFDTNIFQDIKYRFYPLNYADADSLVKILGQMFESYGPAIQSKINMIAITRLNSLLVISRKQQVLEEISGFVKEYDVPSTSTESGIFVYSVKNGRAKEISDILQQVFTGRQVDREESRDKVYRNPLSAEAKAAKQEASAGSGPGERKAAETNSARGGGDVTIGSGSLRGEVTITADEVRNNLIIEATPADYQVIKNLLQEIDILPRQVLIEVTIAEVTLDKSSELGVEWSYLKGEENLSTSLLEATLGDAGLRYTIGKADRWTAAMKALASNNKVNILSSPSIVASNSESAKIDISSEIPVASSQYEYTSGDNPVVSTNIEYRDTGVLLNVTPHINKNGIVTMEISQEVSEQATSVQVGSQNYPSFFKRSADTILTVASGQTIVIGGLIRENRSDGSSGAPWFINIPVIKYFFGRSSESFEKTELVIMISPHVITSLDDVDAVTHEFKSKMGSLFKKGNNEAGFEEN